MWPTILAVKARKWLKHTQKHHSETTAGIVCAAVAAAQGNSVSSSPFLWRIFRKNGMNGKNSKEEKKEKLEKERERGFNMIVEEICGKSQTETTQESGLSGWWCCVRVCDYECSVACESVFCYVIYWICFIQSPLHIFENSHCWLIPEWEMFTKRYCEKGNIRITNLSQYYSEHRASIEYSFPNKNIRPISKYVRTKSVARTIE